MISAPEFDALYDRYKSDVFHLACYLARDRGEAEDLFQDVWLRVVKHPPEKRAKEDLKPWLLTVLVNLHRDRLRRHRIRKLFLIRAAERKKDGAEETGADPALDAEQAVLQKTISAAIARLPERQRHVFLLKEVEGLSQTEIAVILGIPVGTVKSLLFRASKRLRGELSEYNPGRERMKCDVKILSV
jgi:RNA polymerase sigma-70 factor (ECF subfamily)